MGTVPTTDDSFDDPNSARITLFNHVVLAAANYHDCKTVIIGEDEHTREMCAYIFKEDKVEKDRRCDIKVVLTTFAEFRTSRILARIPWNSFGRCNQPIKIGWSKPFEVGVNTVSSYSEKLPHGTIPIPPYTGRRNIIHFESTV